MLKFFSLVFAILLITVPEFCTTSDFAVEAVTGNVIKLEPLASEHHESQYIKRNAFPNLREGEIVTVKLLGKHIIGLQLDQKATYERQAQVANLLIELESRN